MLKDIRTTYLHGRAVYHTMLEMIDRDIKNLKDEIKNLEAKKELTKPPNWICFLVDPLAEELAKLLKADYEIHHLSEQRERINVIFTTHKAGQQFNIVIVAGDLNKGELLYETGSLRKGPKYLAGTKGHTEGLNNQTKPLPKTILEIITFIVENKSVHN